MVIVILRRNESVDIKIRFNQEVKNPLVHSVSRVFIVDGRKRNTNKTYNISKLKQII